MFDTLSGLACLPRLRDSRAVVWAHRLAPGGRGSDRDGRAREHNVLCMVLRFEEACLLGFGTDRWSLPRTEAPRLERFAPAHAQSYEALCHQSGVPACHCLSATRAEVGKSSPLRDSNVPSASSTALKPSCRATTSRPASHGHESMSFDRTTALSSAPGRGLWTCGSRTPIRSGCEGAEGVQSFGAVAEHAQLH